MGNVCYKCGKAYADKCEKIADGVLPDGWTQSYCPFFILDGWNNTGDICEVLGISRSTFFKKDKKKLKAFAKEKGYKLYIEKGKGKYLCYFLKKITPL